MIDFASHVHLFIQPLKFFMAYQCQNLHSTGLQVASMLYQFIQQIVMKLQCNYTRNTRKKSVHLVDAPKIKGTIGRQFVLCCKHIQLVSKNILVLCRFERSDTCPGGRCQGKSSRWESDFSVAGERSFEMTNSKIYRFKTEHKFRSRDFIQV